MSSPASSAARRRWADQTPEQRRANTSAAREALRRKALDRYVADVVTKAPELSPEQRDIIASALAHTSGGGGR